MELRSQPIAPGHSLVPVAQLGELPGKPSHRSAIAGHVSP